MTDYSKKAGLRQMQVVDAFSKVKDLVRQLEDDERRVGDDFVNAEIEFKLNPSEVAWYVAYKTLAEPVMNVSPAALSDKGVSDS